MIYTIVASIIAIILFISLRKNINRIIRGILFLFIIVLIIGSSFIRGMNFGTYVGSLNINWNLNIPKAEKELKVLDSGSSFHGDGEDVVILQYSKEKLLNIEKELKWEQCNKYIVEDMQRFYSDSNESYKKESLVLDNKKKYLYFHKFENNNYDWVTFLLDERESCIYVFESHM
ncbi:hypothetical protein UT300019_00210 [Clostridium sp. CTA-19]